MSETITFSFGKNWNEFIQKHYTKERLDEAVKSLRELVQLDDFAGKTFVDIGCGSGLFSLGAFTLHAKEIFSFDVDPASVATTQYLRQQQGSPAHWRIEHGSILNEQWVKEHVPIGDIVYSWGVLHHTGDMWNAIDRAAQCVKPGGRFVIAIYNNWSRFPNSRFWWYVKRIYNRMPSVGKRLMEYMYFFVFVLMRPYKIRKMIRYIRSYQTSRGMNWWTDVKDWLGGFPYEYATVEEITSFCKKYDMTLQHLIPTTGTGCNQFLFLKKA